MGTRLELHEELVNAFKKCYPDDDPHVYYQPPESVKLVYPCIVYSLADVNIAHADNIPYKKKRIYQVSAIDRKPDSPLPSYIEDIPRVRFERPYVSDNLWHFVYRITY